MSSVDLSWDNACLEEKYIVIWKKITVYLCTYNIFTESVNTVGERATDYLNFCFKILLSKYIIQVPTDVQ